MNTEHKDDANKPDEVGEDNSASNPSSFLSKKNSSAYFVVIVICSIIAVNFIVLSALHAYQDLSPMTEIVVGTFAAVMVLAPLLYLLTFCPLAREIRTRKKMETELTKLAMTDNLTKLSNRAKFYEVIERETERFRRHNQPLSILLFDIDGFKTINDTYGHNVGDEALKSLTKLVGAQLREVDYFVRWGGDEFIIVAPDTGIDKAASLAERARRVVEAHIFQTIGSCTITFSVAQFQASDTVDSFIKRADRGLYKAKEAGKNRVEVCA